MKRMVTVSGGRGGKRSSAKKLYEEKYGFVGHISKGD